MPGPDFNSEQVPARPYSEFAAEQWRKRYVRLSDEVLRLVEVVEVEPPERINPEIQALAAFVREIIGNK